MTRAHSDYDKWIKTLLDKTITHAHVRMGNDHKAR